MRFFSLILLVLHFSSSPLAQEKTSQEILKQYNAFQLTQEELSFYSLNWVMPFEKALQKAAHENRPLFFIWLTNRSGPTNFFSGHC